MVVGSSLTSMGSYLTSTAVEPAGSFLTPAREQNCKGQRPQRHGVAWLSGRKASATTKLVDTNYQAPYSCKHHEGSRSMLRELTSCQCLLHQLMGLLALH